jgi:hypothetical protein
LKETTFKISNELKILLTLPNIKGKFTKNELLKISGVGNNEKTSSFINKLEELELIKKDGIKYISFGKYDLYSVNHSNLARFVDEHETLREYSRSFKEIDKAIYIEF